MSLSLGEKLRQAREERGISVSEVAEQTRISPLYIKAIENDDYKPLPGGIFNKGFVRSYARYVGFDENEALQDYADLMAANEMSQEVDQSIHHSEVWTDDRSARSMAPTIIFALIILVLFTGGIIALVRYLSGPSERPVAGANSNPAANSQASTDQPNNPPAAVTPQPGGFVVELKANSENVWVGYTLDGTKSENIVAPGDDVKLDVQNSIRMGFAKVRASNLEIAVNGKHLNVLGGGAKGNFDFEINKSNIAQIMQSGEIGTPAATPRPAPVRPRPTPRPVASPAATIRPPLLPPANVIRRPPE